METIRVLIACRLSDTKGNKEGGDRIDRDEQAARQWAAEQGDRAVIDVTRDPDVSGNTSHFERDGLGPWLTDPDKAAQYDEIAFSSVDRIGRNLRKFHKLCDWCDEQRPQKRLYAIQEGLCYPERDAREVRQWAEEMTDAEYERNRTKARTAKALADLHANGYLVGKAPYGFKVTGRRLHKTLEPVPELAPVLVGMVKRAIAGDTLVSIANWLDAEGVPTTHADGKTQRQAQASTNHKSWAPKTVWQILKNPALKGERYRTVNGRSVLAFKHEGVISAGTFLQLERSLASKPRHGGRPKGAGRVTPFLTGVIRCGVCGQKMYKTVSRPTKASPELAYYRCSWSDRLPKGDPGRHRNMVPQSEAEELATAFFTNGGRYADQELKETTVIPGNNHAAEIAEVDAQIKALDPADPDYLDLVVKLHKERQNLAALPVVPDRIEETPTGQTIGSLWPSLSEEQKRALLRELAKFYVRPAAEEVATWPSLSEEQQRILLHEAGLRFKWEGVEGFTFLTDKRLWVTQFDGNLSPGAVLRRILEAAK